MAESSKRWSPTAVSAIVPTDTVGEWEVRGFSFFNSDKGTGVTSKTLCEAAGARFALMLYPAGHKDQNETSEKKSSIYVRATCRHNIRISYKISVISKTGEALQIHTDEKFLMDKDHRAVSEDIEPKQFRGFPEYLRYSRLCGIAKDNDDVLQLRLEIKAWPEHPVVQEEVVGAIAPAAAPRKGSLAQDLETLLADGTATDVVLQVSGDTPENSTTVRAHKLLLAARSPVFKQMFFSSEMAESVATTVNIYDVEPKVVVWFLHALYTDEIPAEISEDDEALCHLLAVAHKYQVQALLEHCESGIASKLTEDNACERLMMADLLGITGLRTHILQYVGSSKERMAQLQRSEGFSRMVAKRPQLLVDILALVVAPATKRRPPVPDLPENLPSLTVSDLKSLLNDRGLSNEGNKAAMISRLQQSSSVVRI